MAGNHKRVIFGTGIASVSNQLYLAEGFALIILGAALMAAGYLVSLGKIGKNFLRR